MILGEAGIDIDKRRLEVADEVVRQPHGDAVVLCLGRKGFAEHCGIDRARFKGRGNIAKTDFLELDILDRQAAGDATLDRASIRSRRVH